MRIVGYSNVIVLYRIVTLQLFTAAVLKTVIRGSYLGAQVRRTRFELNRSQILLLNWIIVIYYY